MGRSVHQHTRDRPDEMGTNSKCMPDERAVTRKGSNIFGIRNDREMRTLGQALDQVLSGRLSEATDTLMQRMHAI
eukprot:5068591-Amphidinium_carterae.1